MLAVVPGARDAESVEEVVDQVKDRTGGRVMDLMTSDDYPAYETAILQAYGQEVTTTPSGRPSHRLVPAKVPPPRMNSATRAAGLADHVGTMREWITSPGVQRR